VTDKFRVLVTSRLEADVVDIAADSAFDWVVMDFIDTVEVHDILIDGRIRAAAAARTCMVATSGKAVEAIARVIGTRVPIRLFCIGHQTASLATKLLNCTIEGAANNAGALADIIIAAGCKNVLFACGGKRLDVLPDKLAAAGVKVEEVTVYHTLQLLHKVDESFDGILFFSPSAVESFFQNNVLPDGAAVFAIGDTTAAALARYTSTPVVVSTVPTKTAVIETAVAYFNRKKSTNQ
jgi:uroporphyrinogen-III synthase